jgi:uncharacterized protein (TIGR02598 family)
MKFHPPKPKGVAAFSLVEVVLAIGICSFVLISVLGLVLTGIASNRQSEQEIQEANFASMLISMRTAASTNNIASLPKFAIPATALTNIYGPVSPATTYVGLDGQTTNETGAVYQITCSVGTTPQTGSSLAQVYLMLSSPPQMNPANANAIRYEITSYIPIP